MYEPNFSRGGSALTKADPRVNLLGALLFSIVIAVAWKPATLAGGMAAAISLAAAARVDWRQTISRLLVVNGFVIFIWIILPFSFPGTPILRIGPLAATREGVEYCLIVTVKSNAIVLANIALLATRPIVDLVHAMSHLRAPEKFIHLFFFFFRYLHLIDQEYRRLRDAMKIRAFRPATDARTYKAYAGLAGVLLINSYDRSLRVRDAMKCRGFDGQYRLLNHFHMRPYDYGLIAAHAAVCLALACLEWGGEFF